MNHTEVLDTLLRLSRPAPDPTRVATFDKLLVRVAVVQTQYANARAEHHALAERIATLDMKALLPKTEPAAYPVVGRLYHGGVALRDHLDLDLRELRDDVRAARSALTGDQGRFVSAIKVLERDLERAETNIVHAATLVKVIESALHTLATTPFTVDYLVVPKIGYGQLATSPQPAQK